MREYYLWTDKYEFISINGMEITKSLNNHGRARIWGVVHERNKDTYLQSLLGEQWVKLLVRGEEDSMEVLFCGLVLQAEMEDGDVDTVLKLELVTGTYLLDKEEHYRVLQKEKFGMWEILDEIGRNYLKYRYFVNEDLGEMAGMRVQYKETDWQFIKRLAGEKGCCIVPDCYRAKSLYVLRFPGMQQEGEALKIGNAKYI